MRVILLDLIAKILATVNCVSLTHYGYLTNQ